MAKSEWGTKRTCTSCGDPFYDLKKKNIECPKCGAPFNPEPAAKPKRPAPSVTKPAEQETPKPANDEAAPKAAAGGEGDNLDLALEGDDAAAVVPDDDALLAEAGGEEDEKDDALIEDTSDLSRDDDDVSEVKEHIDDGVEDKN